MRNTVHKLSTGKTLLTIGDPHLGRKFVTNVPLESRGIREAQLFEKYESLVSDPKADFVVMMGDLFDKFDVSNKTILDAWKALYQGCRCNQNTLYIFNRGNHDASRDKNVTSSWEIFRILSMQSYFPNLWIPDDSSDVWENMGVVPWHPFKSPKEMVSQLFNKVSTPLECVFTHNDVSTYGAEDGGDNLMAFDELKKITNLVYNGHVHVPSTFSHSNGLKVVNTGSMMPLNFSEDPEGDSFVTLTLEKFLETSPEDLRYKSVRVILKPDEVAPDPISCLQFKIQRVSEKGAEDVGDVTPENFELKTLFDTSMAEVKEPLKTEAWEFINV